MTNEQIQILVEHGDLFPGFGTRSLQGITIKEMEYSTSEDIAVIISILYTNFLEERFIWSFGSIKGKLDHKLEIYSTDMQDRKLLFNKMILDENEKLDKINLETFKDASAMEIEWCYPLRPEDPYYATANYFQVTEEFLSTLKFDVFNGLNISATNLNKYKECFWKLEKYFEQENMIRCFEVEDIYKNISYLKELIAEIDNPEDNKQYIISEGSNNHNQAVKENIFLKRGVSFDINNGHFQDHSLIKINNGKALHEDPEENKFCKGMPVEIAREHFKELTELKNKKGEPFLKNEQLELFICRAFKSDLSIGKLNFNLTAGKSLKIRKIFYLFYLMATDPASGFETSSYCKEKYIKLLTDNFNGFNFAIVKNNFR